MLDDANNDSTLQDDPAASINSQHDDTHHPVVFPSETNNNNENFYEACMIAAETCRELHLTQDAVLGEIVRLKKRQQLTIRGFGNRISGSLHSLFLLNNSSKLILDTIHLSHTMETEDHAKVGGAINLRYKSSLEMTRGSIWSSSGFCCWAVQKTSVQLVECDLHAPTRSACVVFGKPTCRLEKCTIANAGVHAVCARGDCSISLENCTISNSAARAVYAYANASVKMTNNCLVTGTLHPQKAAIEVSSAAAGGGTSSSSLFIQDCRIIDNAGAGIRIRGPVAEILQGNTLERNYGGNIDYRGEEEDKEGGGLRRDEAGSSFRRGDWWCFQCQPNQVRKGKSDHCPQCGSEKIKGRLLTVTEIKQCNQGVAETLGEKDTWWFDGDDEWLPYDQESNSILEETYQNVTASPTVFLRGGKYQVNIQTMQQVNVETQFPRLVRRGPDLRA